jgi:hypothetical protein
MQTEFSLRPRDHVTSAIQFRARAISLPNFALIRKGGCNEAFRLRVFARSAFRLGSIPPARSFAGEKEGIRSDIF